MIRYLTGLALFGLATLGLPLTAQQPGGNTPVGQVESVSCSEVAVLGYGNFVAAEGMSGITEATFRAQMLYLKEQGITPVSLQQFLEWRKGNGEIPRHCVLITLDEADAAAYKVALPVLQQYGFPFVVFTDARCFQESPTHLSVQKLQEMRRAGATVGSRTMTRPLACDWTFAAERSQEAVEKMAERELGVSAQRITATFGSCEAFSYPRGYADSNMVEHLAVYGYKAAFCRIPGKVNRETSAYMLNRYMIADMPGFAKAVNFGPAEKDAEVLQRVRDIAARHLPVSSPVEVSSPMTASGAFPAFANNAAAGDAVQPPLPPVVDPLPGLVSDAPEVASVPIPSPVAEQEESPQENLKDPVLMPRPVSTLPAAGTFIKRSPDGDWVTREFSQPLVPREQTRVAVLGYHDFSNSRPVSEMCMRTAEFCQQMQYIKDAGLTVITMQDFQEWLLGDRRLPERCVLITIDDGWRSVYSEAFPVLRAYGYPFTLYLYTEFLKGQGLALQPEMIREMMTCGATIGCHSATHLYPSKWKAHAPDSPEYEALLQQELVDAVADIKKMFGNCSTYCYPGGYFTPAMLEKLQSTDVKLAFTVYEKKVTTLETPLQVHRYMVFGTDPRIFRRAVNFDDVAGIKPTAQGITEARARAESFFPPAFEGIGNIPEPPEPMPEPDEPPSSLPEPLPAPIKVHEPDIPHLEDIPAPEYTSVSA